MAGARDIIGETPTRIELGFVPAWIVPIEPDATVGTADWMVIADDGRVVLVDPDGVFTPLGRTDPAAVPVALESGGEIRAAEARDLVDAEFSDARPTFLDDGTPVHLDGPTDRYPHGVLGTDTEAEQLVIGEVTVELDRDVFEAVTPMVADLDGDGIVEIVSTQSNRDDGATIVAYRLDGREFARTDPVGRGNRWRHQIAVAPTGPDGAIELIEVRTPHIGGIVQFHQLRDGQLTRVAELSGYSSHRYGSPNLAMSAVFDADDDGAPELVVPTQNLRALALIARTEGGAAERARLELTSALSTNLAVAESDDAVRVAFGTADGWLTVWP